MFPAASFGWVTLIDQVRWLFGDRGPAQTPCVQGGRMPHQPHGRLTKYVRDTVKQAPGPSTPHDMLFNRYFSCSELIMSKSPGVYARYKGWVRRNNVLLNLLETGVATVVSSPPGGGIHMAMRVCASKRLFVREEGHGRNMCGVSRPCQRRTQAASPDPSSPRGRPCPAAGPGLCDWLGMPASRMLAPAAPLFSPPQATQPVSCPSPSRLVQPDLAPARSVCRRRADV